MLVPKDLQKHAGEFARALSANQFEASPDGLFFPRQKALVAGVYTHDVNGADERTDTNLVTPDGLNYLLGTALYGTTPEAAWFLALFAGNVTVLSSWAASNFPTVSSEITSGTAGYSEPTRRPYTPGAPTGAAISNAASKASFTIASPGTLTVQGAALLSSAAKGSTAGILLSASRFSPARNLENGDIFNLGYTLTLTSS